MKASIKVEGMDLLAGQLERLKQIPQGPALRQACLDGAEEIRSEAERRAPIAPRPTQYGKKFIAPGGLRKSLRAVAGRKYDNFIQAFALTLARVAPHAHLVNFGTKPHVIRGLQRIHLHAMQWAKRVTTWQFRKVTNHPGAKANPFFTDAIRAKRSSVKRRIEAAAKAAFDALGARAA